ncbi:MAG: phosphonate ABC transporter substrate-binding protein [Thermincolia bacterium]
MFKFSLNKRAIVLGLCLVLAGVFAAGCSSNQKTTGAETTAAQTEEKKPEITTLKMGLIPAEDSAKMIENYKPLMAYIGKQLNVEIEPFVATDYTGIVEAMRAKKIDLAWFGPFSYVMANELADAEAFVVEVRPKGGRTYKSLVVTHKDSGINTIEELKGKNYAFVDVGSTSGNLIPRSMYQKKGIEPEKYFKNVLYAGGHDAVALAIKNKKVDAGSMDDVTFNNMIEKGLLQKDELKVIWESDPIPGSPIAYRKDLPEDIKAKLKEVLLNVHNEDPTALGGIGKVSRYEEATDADYQVIKDTAKELNLDLKKMKK